MKPTVAFISFARSWSLARQLFALQAVVVAIVLAGVTVAAYLQFEEANDDAVAREVLGIAHTLAADPAVAQALRHPSPSDVLQPLSERVRQDTATDFVVVMTTDGVRYSHPTPSEIGRHFLGTTEPSTRGESITETYPGTLGPSVRAVVPVSDGGRVVALVSVGRTVTAVARDFAGQAVYIAVAAAVALLLAAAGAWLVSRWLRRTTHDLGPAELSRMYTYYDAVLRAVREGMVLLDREARVQLVNNEAARLLGIDDGVRGRRIDELGLPAPLAQALAARSVGKDEIHLTGDGIVVVNQQPAAEGGRDLGTVVTLRDHTELRALVNELATIRGFADSLNAQAHEAANQLHTVISLIELGRTDEALAYATSELEMAQHLTDVVLAAIAVPELAALVVGKSAEAAGRGVELSVAEGALMPEGVADPRDLVTIVGNLLDNAIDAALDAPEPRWVRLDAAVAGEEGDGELVLRVSDSGRGLAPGVAERIFVRGFTTKHADPGLGRGIGLALVRQAAHRHGGAAEVAPGKVGAVFTVRLPLPATVAPTGGECTTV